MKKQEPPSYLDSIAQAIFDKKGFNILALDVREISSLTDFVIIAEGNIEKHVSALTDAITDRMKELGQRPSFVEGNGDWIVIDYLHVMVHLFSPGIREKYQLEQLWKDGEIVDLKIDTASKLLQTSSNSFVN